MASGLLHDVRRAARSLRRSPAFLAVALVTMAAGIGASTAIFSAVDAVLLRPLPYPQPERLVALYSTRTPANDAGSAVSYPDVEDFRAQAPSLASLAAYRSAGAVIGGGEPEYLPSARVTPEFFDVLAVPPALGALLPPSGSDSTHVVVLTHGLWRRRFGADPGVVGRQVVLDREPYTVVGVLPARFRAPGEAADATLFTPLALDGADNLKERGSRYLQAVGRLRADATVAQAQAELGAIAERLGRAYTESNEDRGVLVRALHEDAVGDARAPLVVLMAAVACVLLIAGTNIAHLLLPRALARRREIAVRVALGASRARVARELLVEVMMLWLVGAAAGAAVAAWAVSALVALAPPATPRLLDIGVDARVLAFAMASALATGLLFGVFPALAATRVAPGDALREGGRSAGLARRRASSALVVAEMALALVLLVGAGLALGTLRRLIQEPPGFDPDGVLTAEMSLPGARYPGRAERGAFYQALLERVRALPGVTSAAVVTPLPLSGESLTSIAKVPERPQPASERPRLNYHAASPQYFDVMRIPLLRGRLLADSDRRGSKAVAVISQGAAKQLFPGQDPLGRRFEMGITVDDDDPTLFEVVGVVGDVHHTDVRGDAEPDAYVPHQQHTWGWTTVVIRSRGSLTPLAAGLRQEVARLDPEQALMEMRTMSERVDGSLGAARFLAALLSLFAGVAMLLAAVGLYGVLSTVVTQRTPEIGLRMAVGAEVRHVLRMVVGHAARMAALGIVVGGLAAAALSRLMGALLFRITPTDPATFTAVAAALFAVALAAAARPAWRAAHVDPAVALRDE
jgi:putative ABC transport system permease protein